MVVLYSKTFLFLKKKLNGRVFWPSLIFPGFRFDWACRWGKEVKRSALFARYSAPQNDHVRQVRVGCNIKVTPSLKFSCQKKDRCCLGRRGSLHLKGQLT